MFLTKLFQAISNLLIHTCLKLGLPTTYLPYEIQRYGTISYLEDKFERYLTKLEKRSDIHHVSVVVGWNLYYTMKDELDDLYQIPNGDQIDFLAFKGARIYRSDNLSGDEWGWGMKVQTVLNPVEVKVYVENEAMEWATIS